MAVNNKPIFTGTPDIQWISGISAAGAADLTSGTSYLVFTSNVTNGGYVQKIRFKATPGTNITNAAACRIWINNGGATSTASNSVLFDEITLPSITASATAASNTYELPLNFALPAGYKIYVSLGQATSTGSWNASVVGGSYVAQT